jgi:hypothetical protein
VPGVRKGLAGGKKIWGGGGGVVDSGLESGSDGLESRNCWLRLIGLCLWV